MSTTDDTTSTSTPDATLDPATVAEVEQALNTVQTDEGGEGGGTTTDGGIPHGEIVKPGTVAQVGTATRQGGGVAQPNGGIPVGEVITVDGAANTGVIQVGEQTHQGGGVARPNGGIPHGETVRP